MASGLTFSIYPDGETVSLALFNRAIQDVQRIVIDVDYAVTGEKGVRRWVIQELRTSIPTVTIRPLLHHPDIVDVILGGIRVVTEGSLVPPDFFTEQTLEDLKRMRRLFSSRDRARHLEFFGNGSEKTRVSGDIGEKVDRILRYSDWNLGSLEGTLDAVNFHGNPTFTMWDRMSKRPVRCYFPEDRHWKDRIKSLLEKRVLVSGKVNYFRNGLPRSITQIVEVEDRTRDENLPPATFGSIPYKEGKRDSYLVLRQARGEQK